jgi:hypothetical protein
MKSEKEESRSANEVQLELKYCERCGGLWLRPAGGGEVYCGGCARKMAQLPPASKKVVSARMCEGPEWGKDQGECEIYDGDEEIDLEGARGLA